MKTEKKMHFILALLGIGIALIYFGCFPVAPWTGTPAPPGIYIELQDGSGRRVDTIEVGKTLLVGVRGLRRHTAYRVELRDRTGVLVSFYQLTTDHNGVIETTPLWYHSGIIGGKQAISGTQRSYHFLSFEEAEQKLSLQSFNLKILDLQGTEIFNRAIPVKGETDPSTPFFFFSNGKGDLLNRCVESRDAVYLTGLNLPPGSTVQIFLVLNRWNWRAGMPLQDVRSSYSGIPQVINLKENQRRFTRLLWPAGDTKMGAYDAVIRLNRSDRSPRLWRSDIVTYKLDTGLVVTRPSGTLIATRENLDIAGGMDRYDGYPYFKFRKVLEAGEPLWCVLDPVQVPFSEEQGSFAAFYVIPRGGAAAGLSDITEGLEVVPVKSGCLHFSMIRVWNRPTRGEYDIVVDFGKTAGTSAAGRWTADNSFNRDIDLLDSAAAVVVDDPADNGPFNPREYSYRPGTSQADDPLRTDISPYFATPDEGVTETMEKVPLQGIGYYPSGLGPFPLVLVVHGNHSPAHPSQEGYDYLCRLLASHGIIAVSIDENFLNGRVSGEMDARAMVILRHLQLWRRWNKNRQHVLYGKVNLNRIGLCGHSRGGEAVTVAHLFNKTLHDPGDPLHNFDFKIRALCCLAPVDGQVGGGYEGTPIRINNADYLVLHGSHDGDVFTFDGQKTFDRAFPDAASAAGFKALVFACGANHNYWNTVWASFQNDADRIESPLRSLSQAEQQSIARVYVSAFFQLALRDHVYAKALKFLMTGEIAFTSMPTRVKLVHQYTDRNRLDLNHYEEDRDYSTGSYAGITNTVTGLNPLLDRDISGDWLWDTCRLDNPYFTWNRTAAVIAGWRNPTAGYDIRLPGAVRKLVKQYNYLSMRIGQVYEKPASLNKAGKEQDLSVLLELAAAGLSNPVQESLALNISEFAALPYPVSTLLNFGACRQKDITKTVMKTVRIPLRRFLALDGDIDSAEFVRIKLRFNQSRTGLVVMDDIQLTQ